MSKTLEEIARKLKDSSKKVQLIYAFNGTGKTRLSMEFKKLVSPSYEDEHDSEASRKLLYYNAFTEDLFYWDNDLDENINPKLNIQPNTFTDWILRERGDGDIIENFQRYTNDKLMPLFHEKDVIQAGRKTGLKTYPEVTFSFQTGSESSGNIKISKGEESCFIWSVFYTIISEAISILSENIDDSRSDFRKLKYIYIDDPVSSLDENYLIELAVDVAKLIKSSPKNIKFIISTHNPLFFNVIYNTFRRSEQSGKKSIICKSILKKLEDNTYSLDSIEADNFSYHLFIKSEVEKAIKLGQLKKHHFNFVRNLLEKTAIFLGYSRWQDIFPEQYKDEVVSYEERVINIKSHSDYAGDESVHLNDNIAKDLENIMNAINETLKFKRT